MKIDSKRCTQQLTEFFGSFLPLWTRVNAAVWRKIYGIFVAVK